MLWADHATRHEVTLPRSHRDGRDTLATTSLLRILGDRCALAVAPLGHDEQVSLAVRYLHAQHPRAILEGDATHA